MAWDKTQNLAGPAGVAGANGLDGSAGPAGVNGLDGAVGPQGPAGNDGAQGPAGPNAVSYDAGNTTKLGSDGLIYTPAPPYAGSGVIMKNGTGTADNSGNAWIIFNYAFPSANYFIGITPTNSGQSSVFYVDSYAPDRCQVHFRNSTLGSPNQSIGFSYGAMFPYNPTRFVEERFITADPAGIVIPADDYINPSAETIQ